MGEFDKFLQPDDGIRIVSRAQGPRHMLTDDALARAVQRVQLGENIDDVAAELAIEQVELEQAIK